MSVFLTYMSVFCAYRGQKKISDFMGMDSQVAVNCPVGTWVTWRSRYALNHEPPLQSVVIYISRFPHQYLLSGNHMAHYSETIDP